MRLEWNFAASCAIAMGLFGQDLSREAWRLEARGDGADAREQLRQAVQSAPNDPIAAEIYAEFLDRHHDPGARDAYERLNRLLARNNASLAERARIARRQTLLDLMAGDRASATRHLNDFKTAGGTGLSLAPVSSAPPLSYIEIPGPLRSFARMSAISPDVSPQDFLTSLAHNVNLNGYSASRATDSLEPTEYLKLVNRYLSQAREIEKLAGPDKMVKIDTCESTLTGDLLRVLGYRMRGGCGSDVVLETVNATRAFITIDSGFPISDLEQALRTNRPFNLDYHPARVGVQFGADYWQPRDSTKKEQPEFIDFFMGDPSLCRLYMAMAGLDPATSEQIRKDMPAQKAKIYAHIWDFFGSMFEVRNGRAVVPGGARSERAWTDMVGTAPDKGAVFFQRLVEKDDGWIASYFDALARIGGPAQEYLTEPDHLKRYYLALRGRVTSPGPARPVFRANTDLILLTTRLRMDSNGKPHLPGGIDVWKNLFSGKGQAKYDARLAKAAPGWKEPEEVLEALFGMARKTADNEPLKIFMAITDLERNRTQRLDASTANALVADYRLFGAQYPVLAESPSVSNATILSFLEGARTISQIRDIGLRSDAAGVMQGLAGFWQIFVRTRTIGESGADAALATIVQPFAKVQNSREIFDAGQKGVLSLLAAANAPAAGSAQDHLMDLLAGTKAAGNARLSDAHQQMIQAMTRVFEAQRLVSLDTLFNLADRLESAANGQKPDAAQVARLATRITEINLPRAALTTRERSEMAAGFWSDKHIETLRRLNLRSAVDRAGADPQKLREVRGMLAPVLRDTLVGLNYIHYAPPGAQVLYTNPTFVRSHDFHGTNDRQRTWAVTSVVGSGWPANAGGRLVGSLIALPYALAECEQNFLIPSREQALIWGDLVPQMIQSAVIPRWWNVTPPQLHWVGLHMSYAETALAESALTETARQRVTAVLARVVPPARLRRIEALLAAGEVHEAAENVVPSEMYALATELVPGDRDSVIASEIRRVAAESPDAVSVATISRTFGTPKPVLTNSYQQALLNLRTFPTLMGYSSRILAESWESNLLYYAALADDVLMRPEELNLQIPRWTGQTVEKIFATHLEDWPALLRSLRLVGDGVRQQAHKQVVASN